HAVVSGRQVATHLCSGSGGYFVLLTLWVSLPWRCRSAGCWASATAVYSARTVILSHGFSALLPSPSIGPQQRQTSFFSRLAPPDTPCLCHSIAVRDNAMFVGTFAAANARRHCRDRGGWNVCLVQDL